MALLVSDAVSKALLKTTHKATSDEHKLLIACSLLTIITGFYNWYITSPKEHMTAHDSKVYTATVHSKIAAVLFFFLPILHKYTGISVPPQAKAVFALALVMIGTFARFYREDKGNGELIKELKTKMPKKIE